MGPYRNWPLLTVFTVAAALQCAQAQTANETARAMGLAAKGNYTEAERVLRAIEKADPKNAEVRYALGVISLRQGKNKEAASSFETASVLAPGSALAWVGLAQARLRLGQRGPALDAAGRASRLAQQEPPIWRALALFYTEAGEFARAADFEERWSGSPGADAGSGTRLCRLLVRAADGKRAVNACRQALNSHETAELQQLLGDAYRLTGDPAQAATAYQRAIHLDPAQSGAYLQIAALFLDHRTPQPAIAVLDVAITRFPKEPEFRRRLGLARYQTGALQDAIESFLAAIDLDPDAESGYASLETLLPDAGPKLPEIVGRLRGFRSRRPSSPVGHYLLARSLALEGNHSSGIAALLRQAIQADGSFWPAHFELAQILEEEDRLKDAIQSLETVVKLNPSYAPAHYSLAQLYVKTGDRPRAIAHRKAHHELLDRERAAAEKARAELPALTFRIEPQIR